MLQTPTGFGARAGTYSLFSVIPLVFFLAFLDLQRETKKGLSIIVYHIKMERKMELGVNLDDAVLSDIGYFYTMP